MMTYVTQFAGERFEFDLEYIEMPWGSVYICCTARLERPVSPALYRAGHADKVWCAIENTLDAVETKLTEDIELTLNKKAVAS